MEAPILLDWNSIQLLSRAVKQPIEIRAAWSGKSVSPALAEHSAFACCLSKTLKLFDDFSVIMEFKEVFLGS